LTCRGRVSDIGFVLAMQPKKASYSRLHSQAQALFSHSLIGFGSYCSSSRAIAVDGISLEWAETECTSSAVENLRGS
jgi:hypothetical protein